MHLWSQGLLVALIKIDVGCFVTLWVYVSELLTDFHSSIPFLVCLTKVEWVSQSKPSHLAPFEVKGSGSIPNSLWMSKLLIPALMPSHIMEGINFSHFYPFQPNIFKPTTFLARPRWMDYFKKCIILEPIRTAVPVGGGGRGTVPNKLQSDSFMVCLKLNWIFLFVKTNQMMGKAKFINSSITRVNEL